MDVYVLYNLNKLRDMILLIKSFANITEADFVVEKKIPGGTYDDRK